MRKDIALPVLALAGGGACLALRRWQLAAALDPETELFRSVPATPVLIGVLALSGTVARITKNYIDRRLHGKNVAPLWSAFEEYQREEEAQEAAEVQLDKAANE